MKPGNLPMVKVASHRQGAKCVESLAGVKAPRARDERSGIP